MALSNGSSTSPSYTARDTIGKIYSAFEPFKPAESHVYVHLEAVRGGWDIFREMGRRIDRAEYPTCQLYSGHRGVGKSTELLRLKLWLEERDFFVVYFAADQADIEPEDASYADVILACTRNLVQQVRLETDENPILTWLSSRWGEFKELAQSDVEFESLSLKQKLLQFGELTAKLRAVPSVRDRVRRSVDNHAVSLVKAINEFIDLATRQLQARSENPKRGLVVMADNLDRIVEIRATEEARTNHEQIYLDRSEQMKGLNCHTIYTVPISLVCNRGVEVEDRYGDRDILPMVVVQNRDGSRNAAGMAAMRKVIRLRAESVDRAIAQDIDVQLFESSALLDRVCAMSGGHMRILMQLMQKALDWTEVLPIQKKAIGRALSSVRQTYVDAINFDCWEDLARVHRTKQLPKDNRHQGFLADRCVLKYFEEEFDEEGDLEVVEWFDVHPAILKIDEFRSALARLQEADS
jgi:hypothetical protein